MEKRTCTDCGEEFAAQDVEWRGSKVFCQQRCEDCTEVAQQAYEAAEAAQRKKSFQKAFAEVCPPLYRHTDPSRIHSQLHEAAVSWQYGPQGLGLVGIAGQGKTRAAYLLIQRMLAAGHVVQATTAMRFAKLCVDQFSERERRMAAEMELKAIYRAEVWLLDDLGKQCMTPRSEMELYAVLEHRTSHLLPTIWTSNAPSRSLFRMFSEDRAVPILRRLTEFSRIITVWENETAQKNI